MIKKQLLSININIHFQLQSVPFTREKEEELRKRERQEEVERKGKRRKDIEEKGGNRNMRKKKFVKLLVLHVLKGLFVKVICTAPPGDRSNSLLHPFEMSSLMSSHSSHCPDNLWPVRQQALQAWRYSAQV